MCPSNDDHVPVAASVVQLLNDAAATIVDSDLQLCHLTLTLCSIIVTQHPDVRAPLAYLHPFLGFFGCYVPVATAFSPPPSTPTPGSRSTLCVCPSWWC